MINNRNKGFSLVELIVVLAIVAILTAAFTPALIGYVERSRAARDLNAMSEVTDAFCLGIAKENTYDEVIEDCLLNNVSCYIDKKNRRRIRKSNYQISR